MNHPIRSRSWLVTTITVLMLTLPQGLIAAPPSGGGGGGNKVSVTAANPSEAFQGEELDVTVTGSGFDTGSSVSYLVTGTTDASQVEVLSVQVISSTELRTRIRPKDAALPTEYDIEVRTLSGRKGKGTTLFKVKNLPEPCTDFYPTFAIGTDPAQDQNGNWSLRLVSASGCHHIPLIESLDGSTDSGPVGLSIRGSQGVATWMRFTAGMTFIIGLEFSVDAQGNVTSGAAPAILYQYPDDPDTQQALLSTSDVLIDQQGRILLIVAERDAGGVSRSVSVVDTSTGSYELVTSNACEVLDASGDCFVPTFGDTAWGPSASSVYFTLQNVFDGNDKTAIVRSLWNGSSWSPLEPVLLDTPNAGFRSLTVSLDGLLAYGYDADRHKGKIDRRIGIIDPDSCALSLCNKNSGDLGTARRGNGASWTAEDSLLFSEIGAQNVREYIDPINALEGTLTVDNVRWFDSDL